MKVLLLSHFFYTTKGPVHGPVHSIASFLRRNKIVYQMVGFPLYSGTKSLLEYFNGSKVTVKKFGSGNKISLFTKSFQEFVYTYFLTKGYRYNLTIAIDPLNALAALFLKLLGRTKKVIFYTVDYADQRFVNPLLNFIYHAIDRFCIYFCDEVWNVSSRIYKKRKKQGVPINKNCLVPNAPSFKDSKQFPPSRVDRFNLMMVTGITHLKVFSPVLAAVKALNKKYPKITLTLMGTGPYESSLKQKVKVIGLKNRVIFLGQLEHRQLMATLPKGGVGLALYTNDFPWTYYGDSMKAREYLASGLPVLITNVVSTAEDIKKSNAGLIIKSSEEYIHSALEAIFKDEDYWLKLRENAIKFAREFDMDKILEERLQYLVKDLISI